MQKTRLFFNKEVLPLGQIFIKVGDQIQMTFAVQDTVKAEDEIQPFASYFFAVESLGFRQISGQCKDDLLRDVRTWRAIMTTLDLNFIEDGSYGTTSYNFNQTEAKRTAQKQATQAGGALSRTTGAILNPLKAIKGNHSIDDVLLASIDLEFEARRSNLTDFYAQDLLASCVAEVQFDEANISELQESGAIEDNSTLKMEVVSTDKRCMKTRIREKELIEYLPKTIPQRLFTPDDVIQIQISNTFTHSHVVLLKPIDLPLSLNGSYTHYAQLGNTSQLKV